MRRAAGLALLLVLAAPSHVASGRGDGPAVRAWLASGPPESSLDVVFVGDGYQRKHLAPEGKFWTDVKRYATRMTTEPPFSWYRARTNVRAVFLESLEEGCDPAPTKTKRATALGSEFDAADGRLLYFTNHAALARAVDAAGGADIALVMVNTERYGGAGTVLDEVKVRGKPLPAPTFAAQDTPSFLIALHELGHSFAGLADEYVDPATARDYPLPKDGTDLPEPNVTLSAFLDRTDARSIARTAKWSHFLALPGASKPTWAHEGGYLRATGVWRPWPKCRMLVSEDPYCPICCEEVSKAIVRACGDSWDDAAWHKAHPLSLWK
jgi:hypothetical protein